MPIYFSLEENKFYNSNFLKGVSGFDFSNGNKFYPVSDNDYKNILLQNYKNNLNYNFVGGETGFFFSPKSLTFSSKEEKMTHFSNLMKKYVNSRRCFLGYPKDIEAYISSGETSWANDAQSFLNWKSDVEKKTNELIRDFILGLTSNEPSFSRIVTSNDFPRLRSYNDSYSRDSFFMDRIPSKIRDEQKIDPPGGSGPAAEECTVFDPDPKIILKNRDFGFFNTKNDFLLDAYEVGEAVGVTHYNTTMNDHLNNFLNKSIDFDQLVENILFGGNFEIVKFPVLSLIETSPNGSTASALGIFVPSTTSDGNNNSILIGSKLELCGCSADDEWGSDAWWQHIYDEYVKPISFLKTCCGGIPSEENFYDPIENPCGILESCVSCFPLSKISIEVDGPVICADGIPGNLPPQDQWTDEGLRRLLLRLREARGTWERNTEVFEDDFDCHVTQNTWTGSPCCPPASDGNGLQRSCPIYINGEAVYENPPSPCDCCWDTVEARLSKDHGTAEERIIIHFPLSVFEAEICYIITIRIDYYCKNNKVDKLARSCGCDYCLCQHANCEGVTGCEPITPTSFEEDIDDADSVL